MFKKIYRFFVPAVTITTVIGKLTKQAKAIEQAQNEIIAAQEEVILRANEAVVAAEQEKSMATAFVTNMQALAAPAAVEAAE